MKWMMILAVVMCMAAGPTTKPADISPQAAASAMRSAEEAALSRVKSVPQYIAIRNRISAAEDRAQSARENAAPEERIRIISECNAAKKDAIEKCNFMESDAVNNDPKVKEARGIYAAAVDRSAMLELQKRRDNEAERAKRDAVAEAQWKVDQKRAEDEKRISPVLTFGDAKIEIVGAKIKRVPLASTVNGDTKSDAAHVVIYVEISNQSDSKKIGYKTWAGRDFAFERDYASLTDEFGNVYRRIDFGIFDKPIGRSEDVEIYPGKSIRDVLIFEVPVDNATSLTLELPGKNIGIDKEIKVKFPVSKVPRE